MSCVVLLLLLYISVLKGFHFILMSVNKEIQKLNIAFYSVIPIRTVEIEKASIIWNRFQKNELLCSFK